MVHPHLDLVLDLITQVPHLRLGNGVWEVEHQGMSKRLRRRGSIGEIEMNRVVVLNVPEWRSRIRKVGSRKGARIDGTVGGQGPVLLNDRERMTIVGGIIGRLDDHDLVLLSVTVVVMINVGEWSDVIWLLNLYHTQSISQAQRNKTNI